MKYEEREVTSDGALEWLNNWCGRRVLVAGTLRGVLIFEADGELRHSANVGDPGRVSMENYAGRYCVGSAFTSFKIADPALPTASFCITDIGPSATDTGEALTVTLGDQVLICITRLQS